MSAHVARLLANSSKEVTVKASVCASRPSPNWIKRNRWSSQRLKGQRWWKSNFKPWHSILACVEGNCSWPAPEIDVTRGTNCTKLVAGLHHESINVVLVKVFVVACVDEHRIGVRKLHHQDIKQNLNNLSANQFMRIKNTLHLLTGKPSKPLPTQSPFVSSIWTSGSWKGVPPCRILCAPNDPPWRSPMIYKHKVI